MWVKHFIQLVINRSKDNWRRRISSVRNGTVSDVFLASKISKSLKKPGKRPIFRTYQVYVYMYIMYLEFRWTFSCCCLSVVWSLPLGECHTRSWPVSSSVWYWPCWHVQDRSKLWPHEQELQPSCKGKLIQWNIHCPFFNIWCACPWTYRYILTVYTDNSIKDIMFKKNDDIL